MKRNTGFWKKPLSFIVMLALALTAIPLSPVHAASSGMAWASRECHLYAAIGVCGIKALTPSEWLVSFDTNAGGGNTRIVVSRTQDGGYTWSTPVTAVSSTAGNGERSNVKAPSGKSG